MFEIFHNEKVIVFFLFLRKSIFDQKKQVTRGHVTIPFRVYGCVPCCQNNSKPEHERLKNQDGGGLLGEGKKKGAWKGGPQGVSMSGSVLFKKKELEAIWGIYEDLTRCNAYPGAVIYLSMPFGVFKIF